MTTNQVSFLTSEYLTIQTLQELDGAVDSNANALFANTSSITVGNTQVLTTIAPDVIITPAISVGNLNTNVNINSTAFSVTSYGGSNTYIDAYEATFSGIVTANNGLILNGELNANGLPGNTGQVLVSNGSTPYWSDTANNTSFVGSVSAANVVSNAQLSGNLVNYVTSFNLSNNLANYATISDPAFTGKITVNTFVTIGNTSQNVVANSSAISINGSLVANSTYFSGQALTSNNTNFVGTVSAANVVSNAQLSGNLSNYVTATNLTNNLANYQTSAGLSANVATLTANAATYLNGKTESNLNVNNALTSNNTSFVGSVSAANVVSNAQLSGNLANYVTATNLTNNLANYQTTAGLSANVATLTANNTSFVGTVSAANVVSNAQLSGNLSNYVTATNLTNNLANYQTTAGLSSNVATLTANAATYLNGKTESNLNVNNALTANNTSYLGGVAAASYVNTSGSYTISGVHTHSGNLVIGTTAGVSANGGFGTAGQYLASNGTSVYWTTGASGGFTNGQSISVNNFVITGAMTANSSNGTSGQVLTSNGSSVYWSTAAGGGTTSGLMSRQTFTADGTQNTFTFTAGYQSNALLVFMNGVLATNTEITGLNGSTFQFVTTPPTNAVIDTYALSGLMANGVNTLVSQQITANGTANSFAITGGYIANAVQVFLNGVKQIPGTDVIITSGSNVNFTVTPANNYIIDVYGYQTAVTLTSNTLTVSGTLTANFDISTTYGSVSDALGNVRTVPLNSQGGAYTLTSGDAGKYISITTGGVTVATSTALTAGQSVSIYNDSGSNQTITQGSSVTLRQVGTANTGNRTLAQYGLCTILCVGSNTYVITGGGLT